jgi:hypothetical protein
MKRERSRVDRTPITPDVPPPTLARLDSLLFAISLACLSATVLWLFIAQPTYHSTMIEYVYKFLPALTDHGIAAVFDGNGMGDPRSRLFANFLALVNVRLRALAMEHAVLPPAFSVNWLLYPLCLGLLYKVMKRLSGQRVVAMFAVLLYGASPALLDTLVNYYVPAKALLNVMMLLALYGGSLVFAEGDSKGDRITGMVLVFVASLLGAFSDETALFIYLTLPIVFFHGILSRRFPFSWKALFVAALAGSAMISLVVSFVVLPLINTWLGQVPVQLSTLVTKGVYAAMFGNDPSPVMPMIRQYSPFSLLETIASVHVVPGRFVNRVYTSGTPIPHFFSWPLRDQFFLYVFAALFAAALLRLRRRADLWHLALRLLGAFALFVVGQAFLMLRLASWIVETNYYAALASLFFALIVSVVLAGFVDSNRFPWLSWALVVYLVIVQFSNFVATAARHPNFDSPPLTWTSLRDVHRLVAAGEFAAVVKAHPFPSRLFSYAFEHAAALEHRAGRQVDIRPFAEPSPNLFGYVDLTVIPKITGYRDIGLSLAPAEDEPRLIEAGARQLGPSWSHLLAHSYAQGRRGPWNYVRRFDGAGGVQQRYWRDGLVRVWADRGSVVDRPGETCLRFEKAGEECIARVYEQHGAMFGVSTVGKLVTVFRLSHRPPPGAPRL